MVEGVTRKVDKSLGTNLRVTIAANQGGRKYMEDRVHVHVERRLDKTIDYFFIGVFDGHGGFEASEFVRKHLLSNITKSTKFESKRDEDVLAAIREGFLLTHQQMQSVYDEWPHTPSGYPSTAGTTCSCVFIKNGKIYTGHVGDSAITLGTKSEPFFKKYTSNDDDYGLVAEQLTVDHKPESEKELARIRTAGGDVAIKSGISRVVWKRALKGYQFGPLRRNTPTETIPFLSVARSLGDLWSYCEETKEFVVSPDPDVACRVIKPGDTCLILASDGLTNVLQPQEVASAVHSDERISAPRGEQPNHARALLKLVLQRWGQVRADNVTVAVVMLDDPLLREDDVNLHMRLGQYSAVDEVLTEQPDAMLQLTPTASYVLKTIRTPVIYNGSMDPNFSKISYRGPGFRTHEEELLEEERRIAFMEASNTMEIQEDGRDELEDNEHVLKTTSTMLEEKKLFVSNASTSSVYISPCKEVVERIATEVAPTTSSRPVEDTEGTDEENEAAAAAEATVIPEVAKSPPKSMFVADVPAPTSETRVKKVAARRLRTPKIVIKDDEEEKESEARRPVTRSVSTSSSISAFNSRTLMSTRKRARTALTAVQETEQSDQVTPSRPKKKTFETPEKETGYAIVTRRRTVAAEAAPPPKKAAVPVTPRAVSEKTPKKPETASRKRSAQQLSTPLTLRSSRRLQIKEQKLLLETPSCPRTPKATTGVTPFMSGLTVESPFTSRSAPSTPNKDAIERPSVVTTSKWSLSKLDSMTEEVQEDEDDVAEEPPSKMRKLYKFISNVTSFVGFKATSSRTTQSRGKNPK